jgi:hypothetical protein
MNKKEVTMQVGQEHHLKYVSMRILKSIQEYLKAEDPGAADVYPIKVPSELLYHIAKIQGTEQVDRLVHSIFRHGLRLWADKLFEEVFGSTKELEGFIDLIINEGPKGDRDRAVSVSRNSRSPKTLPKRTGHSLKSGALNG